jgi:hypothetical protein
MSSKPKSRWFAYLVILVGCLCPVAAIFIGDVNFWVGLFVGIVSPAPLIALGIYLADWPEQPEGAPKAFLPSRREQLKSFWAIVFCALCFGGYLLPFVLVLVPFLVVPSGDDLSLVVLRIMGVLVIAVLGYWWVKNVLQMLRWLFGDKVSAEAYAAMDWQAEFEKGPPKVLPKSRREAAWLHWRAAAIAVIALLVGVGVMAIDNPLLRVKNAPRRARGMIGIVQACFDNPNMTRVSALLVGVGASAWFARKVLEVDERADGE